MKLEEITTGLVNAMGECSSQLSSCESAADAYVVLHSLAEHINEAQEVLKKQLIEYMEDANVRTIQASGKSLQYIEATRKSVSGADLAQEAADHIDALSVTMLIDALKAATTIRKSMLSSEYMKLLAGHAEKTKTTKYLSVR